MKSYYTNLSANIVNDGSEPDVFWTDVNVTDKTEVMSQIRDNDGDDKVAEISFVKKISTVRSENEFKKIAPYSRNSLSSDSMYVLENGPSIIVYVGKNVDNDLKAKAASIAENYKYQIHLPIWYPITIIYEESPSPEFQILIP